MAFGYFGASLASVILAAVDAETCAPFFLPVSASWIWVWDFWELAVFLVPFFKAVSPDFCLTIFFSLTDALSGKGLVNMVLDCSVGSGGFVIGLFPVLFWLAHVGHPIPLTLSQTRLWKCRPQFLQTQFARSFIPHVTVATGLKLNSVTYSSTRSGLSSFRSPIRSAPLLNAAIAHSGQPVFWELLFEGLASYPWPQSEQIHCCFTLLPRATESAGWLSGCHSIESLPYNTIVDIIAMPISWLLRR